MSEKIIIPFPVLQITTICTFRKFSGNQKSIKFSKIVSNLLSPASGRSISDFKAIFFCIMGVRGERLSEYHLYFPFTYGLS